ncbi:hypothetical protein [Pseudomonas syringae]|uniref:hypothetical protein n=1 Tax=Pseudomonas syringae TaxID=317 RepID=UPI0006E53D76|nr:hypothetical protein [Pseudomonas syringae]KPY55904.1 hypothetical protein ALO46_200026 [Pseudomonas syringae pv. solidagae]
MSGTDGKLFRDYTSGSPTETACDMLYLQTQLASPKPDVVDQINIDDVLDIGLSNLNGQLVAVALWQGQLAGGIASPRVLRLIACIESGTSYRAAVVDKNGAQVVLRISPIKEG